MDKRELIANFSQELRRGMLILCVLASLRQTTYGYNLIEKLSKIGISIEANTLYPLLRRLEGQGLLRSVWNTEGAKPRKYYNLTEFGDEVLGELKTHWQNSVESMKEVLEVSSL